MVTVAEINLNCMKYILIFSLIFGISINTFGQIKKSPLKGQVTYVTSKNVYVKFESTKLISVGDSLHLEHSKIPCLIVKNKSSKSVVGIVINGCNVKKGDYIIYNYILKKDVNSDKKTALENKKIIVPKKVKPIVYKKPIDIKNLEQISGRFTLASYSDFFNNRKNRQRIVSQFSMYADHINNSKFSFETYLNYSKFLNSNYKQTPFQVYDFAGIYDASPTLKITIGRKINNNTSSLGAIDGLQIEKYFRNTFIGVITGFRPDLITYGFNSNLLQYGAYFGYKTNTTNLYSRTTLGVMEQRNKGKIDRRYAYFQHSSTFYKSLNLFSSFELDMYNKVNNVKSNNLRLSNFYVSARYKFNRSLNTTISYDSRKRVIYYETFKTQVERLLSDDIARQGLRFRINMRPIKYINTGLSYSVRFQSNNLNKSNYLQSNIISFRHSRSIFKNKLSVDLYYRNVDYNYLNNNIKFKQNYFGADLSINISRTLRFSVYGEYLKSNLENSYRINTKIVKRFNNKHKKRNYAY